MNEIIAFIIGILCTLFSVFAYKCGKRLHNNGNGISDARNKLEDSTGRIDTIESGMSEAQGRIADSLDILEKVRGRKGQ